MLLYLSKRMHVHTRFAIVWLILKIQTEKTWTNSGGSDLTNGSMSICQCIPCCLEPYPRNRWKSSILKIDDFLIKDFCLFQSCFQTLVAEIANFVVQTIPLRQPESENRFILTLLTDGVPFDVYIHPSREHKWQIHTDMM